MPAFFQTLEKVRPFYDWAYKIMLFICKLLLIADIIITAWTVAGRYIPFITDPHWSEEIILTFMVYMAVLSALVQGAKVIDPNGNIAKFAKYSSIPTLSQVWMYLPVAVAGAGMIIFELEQVFLRIEEFYKPDDQIGREAQAQ